MSLLIRSRARMSFRKKVRRGAAAPRTSGRIADRLALAARDFAKRPALRLVSLKRIRDRRQFGHFGRVLCAAGQVIGSPDQERVQPVGLLYGQLWGLKLFGSRTANRLAADFQPNRQFCGKKGQ